MAYIVKSDIENLFGADNVLIWSDLSGEGSVDDSRIEQAIDWAEEHINNRFRDGRYRVPLTPVSQTIKWWAAGLAGWWLFMSRPFYDREEEGLTPLKEAIDLDINAYVTGSRRLPCNYDSDIKATAPTALVTDKNTGE